jgi:hypothetical protein
MAAHHRMMKRRAPGGDNPPGAFLCPVVDIPFKIIYPFATAGVKYSYVPGRLFPDVLLSV